MSSLIRYMISLTNDKAQCRTVGLAPSFFEDAGTPLHSLIIATCKRTASATIIAGSSSFHFHSVATCVEIKFHGAHAIARGHDRATMSIPAARRSQKAA